MRKTAVTMTILLVILAVSCFAVSIRSSVQAAPGPWTGEIRIAPDGAVQGTDMITRSGNLYTLVGELSGSVDNGQIFITIEKDGVVFDGSGRTIQGTGTGVAIAAHGRKDITIKNIRIINFGTGIELRSIDFESNSTASNNRVLDNYLETAYFGMTLDTTDAFVSGNTIVSKNSQYGVLFRCNNTVFSNNVFIDGGLILNEPSSLNVFSGNTINGKPLVYLEHQSGQVIDGAAQVILIGCKNMVVQNAGSTANLRTTIELSGTSNTRITNCRGNIVLRNSHSNIIVDNQLAVTGSMASYNSAAIELSASHNNTIAGNSIKATNGFGVSLTASSYNKVQGNDISSTGQAAVKVDTVQYTSVSEQQVIPDHNYIYENNITCPESGISLRNSKNSVVFKNLISGCKYAIMLSGAHQNSILGNTLSGSTEYAIYLSISNYNTFYHNNFLDNAAQAYEEHQVYWWFVQNDTYYSEGNTFDNGKEGNYWDDYTGSDTNGDGIGETPYVVYENFTDQYPLTSPFDISSVTVEFAEWVPTAQPDQPAPPTGGLRIIILSPENITYSASDVPLDLVVTQPVSWLGYSLDYQSNVTILQNTTLTSLSQGTHSLTVYGNTTEGVFAASETVLFSVNAPESFPLLPVAAVSTASISAVAAAGLLMYFKKHKH
ncbi:MAG: right-handed parallel beta-helix repeat-containing protein [Candidatus Bathyarchaeota archaeon]|nr:right-handed parallel beta-helix repeat-containing protein [Candidatus Bathyarchaeota archaeon]